MNSTSATTSSTAAAAQKYTMNVTAPTTAHKIPSSSDTSDPAHGTLSSENVRFTGTGRPAGTPAEMWDKVPQAVNLNTWPATFFIGKDGKVKAVHSGFAAPASGPYHIALKEEFTSILEKLIKEQPAAENAPVTTAPAATSRHASSAIS